MNQLSTYCTLHADPSYLYKFVSEFSNIVFIILLILFSVVGIMKSLKELKKNNMVLAFIVSVSTGNAITTYTGLFLIAAVFDKSVFELIPDQNQVFGFAGFLMVALGITGMLMPISPQKKNQKFNDDEL